MLSTDESGQLPALLRWPRHPLRADEIRHNDISNCEIKSRLFQADIRINEPLHPNPDEVKTFLICVHTRGSFKATTDSQMLLILNQLLGNEGEVLRLRYHKPENKGGKKGRVDPLIQAERCFMEVFDISYLDDKKHPGACNIDSNMVAIYFDDVKPLIKALGDRGRIEVADIAITQARYNELVKAERASHTARLQQEAQLMIGAEI